MKRFQLIWNDGDGFFGDDQFFDNMDDANLVTHAYKLCKKSLLYTIIDTYTGEMFKYPL